MHSLWQRQDIPVFIGLGSGIVGDLCVLISLDRGQYAAALHQESFTECGIADLDLGTLWHCLQCGVHIIRSDFCWEASDAVYTGFGRKQ